ALGSDGAKAPASAAVEPASPAKSRSTSTLSGWLAQAATMNTAKNNHHKLFFHCFILPTPSSRRAGWQPAHASKTVSRGDADAARRRERSDVGQTVSLSAQPNSLRSPCPVARRRPAA